MSWGSRPLGWPGPEFGKAQVYALLFGGLLSVTPASGQIVTGMVVDAADNEPVAGVTITLLDPLAATQRAVVGNSAGKFIMSIASPGTYRLRASRIGYATIESPAIEIGDGEVVEVEVRLAVEAVVLEPLTVVVRRPETQRERDLRGFYERAEHYGESDIGPRQIYTRDNLAGWDAFSVEEVFRFYIRWTPYGSRCNPKVYLDGRQHGHLRELGSMPVSILEGIELYAGSGPPESRFWGAGGCGVVLLWRRALPEGGGGLGAIEILAVAGAAALLLLQAVGLLF